jgi:N6-adenosine-specific RNA methylase IME4
MVGNHYASMPIEEIIALPVADLAHPDGAHCVLWTTGTHLELAFDVLDAWGFKFSSMMFVWLKLKPFMRNGSLLRVLRLIELDFHVGRGKTTRKNAEFALLGRRGSPPRAAGDVRELIITPLREHSRKPDESYERIMRYSPGPYVELFARNRRAGWHSWGREIDRFSQPETSP